jgi:hypothetical protein
MGGGPQGSPSVAAFLCEISRQHVQRPGRPMFAIAIEVMHVVSASASRRVEHRPPMPVGALHCRHAAKFLFPQPLSFWPSVHTVHLGPSPQNRCARAERRRRCLP